jgi:hypothetical protein
MVITNHAWEEETRRYLAEIQTELANVDKQLEELQAKRDALAHETEAFNTALAVHFRRTGRQETSRPGVRELLINQRNHKERIMRIAERNNGMLKIGEAADILYTYGIIKTKSRMNAYRIIYALTADMVDKGIFERSAPGEFRLLGTQPTLPNKRIDLGHVALENIV